VFEDYLEHIAEAIDRATSYRQPVPDLEAFQENWQVQDAVVRNIVLPFLCPYQTHFWASFQQAWREHHNST
jgi:hypothetical protein